MKRKKDSKRLLSALLALIMVLTMLPMSALADDNADINALKAAIVGTTFTAKQVDANTAANANAAVEGIISKLELNGVTAVVTGGTLTEATAGTENKAGTDGSYTFTVTLNKGTGTEQTITDLTLTITATSYAEVVDNNAIAAAKAAIVGTTFTAKQVDANTAANANAAVEGIISKLELNGVTAVVTGGTLTEATAGTENKAGTDGSYTFTVTLNKGTGTEQTITDLTLTITATSYAEVVDNNAIAAAKAAIVGTTFTAKQVDANTAANANAAVEGIISKLELNGVTAVVTGGTLTEATAGTATEPNGKNGSYTFTVTLSKGKGTAQTTTDLTLAITATAYDSTSDDNAAITAAVAEVGKTKFTAAQADAGTVVNAKAAIKGIIDKLTLNGVTAVVNDGTLTEATAGTATEPNGKNGSYTFTVTLSKGKGTAQTTTDLTLAITATAYDSTSDDNAAITAAVAEVGKTKFTAAQADAGTVVNAKAAIKGIIDKLTLNGVTAVVNDGTLTEATAGTATEPNGKNGSYTFTVTLSKGKGTAQTTTDLTLAITATAYDSTSDDNAAITAAVAEVGKTKFTATQADAGTVVNAKAAIKGIIDKLTLNGVTAVVNDGTLTEATAGTATEPNGKNGSYTFTVTLSKGKGTAQTTTDLTLAITATAYDSTSDDNAAITAAVAEVGKTKFTAAQADAGTVVNAKAAIKGIIDKLTLNGVTAVVNDGTLTEATAGTATEPNGKNGSYTFTVTLSKGKGTAQTTTDLTLAITATPYDATSDNADITAAVAKVEAATYTATQVEAGTEVKAKEAVEAIITKLTLNGVEAVVTGVVGVDVVAFKGAEAGTAQLPNGKDGSYKFKVTLTKGGGAAKTTKELALAITATAYDSTVDDNAAIKAAKNAIGKTEFTATQDGAGTAEKAKAAVEGIITKLELNGVKAVVNGVKFTEAKGGTAKDPNGKNGSYTFTVKLSKGKGTAQTTKEFTLTITAMKYLASYTITFDANGGTVTTKTLQTGTNGKLSSLPTPTRSGNYSFDGWFTAASGGTRINANNAFSASTTVYAHWTYKSSGGGGGGPSSGSPSTSTNKNNDATTDTSVKSNSSTSTDVRNTAITGTSVTKNSDGSFTLKDSGKIDVNGKVTVAALSGTKVDEKGNILIPNNKTAGITLADGDTKLIVPGGTAIENNGTITVGNGSVEITVGDSAAAVIVGEGSIITPNGKITVGELGAKIKLSDDTEIKVYGGTTINGDTVTVSSEGATVTVDRQTTTLNAGSVLNLDAETSFGHNTQSGKAFSDVNESSWYYDAAMYVYQNGIMQGVSAGTFDPTATLNRAMLVQMLYNLEGQPTVGSADFDDVTSDDWYSNAIAWASGSDIVNGTGNNNFSPSAGITREQMAVMLYNYCQYKGIELPAVRTGDSFTDADSISSWAADAVNTMYQVGVLSGKGNSMFDPQGTATRAEVAQMFKNFMEAMK